MVTHEPTLRLFVALWPDGPVRDALRACRDGVTWPTGARPTATDRLHLTLHFLGAVPASRRPALEAALAVPCDAFVLTFDRIRAWPGGLVVLQAAEPPPPPAPTPLLTLHTALAAELRTLELPVETRRFRPHVTLARHAQPAPPLPVIEPLRWPLDGHALVQSTPAGYRVLRRYRCA